MKQFRNSFYKSVNHLGSDKNWTVWMGRRGMGGGELTHWKVSAQLHSWRHFQDFKASQPQMLSTEDGKERELLCNKEWFLDTNEENKAVNKSD